MYHRSYIILVLLKNKSVCIWINLSDNSNNLPDPVVLNALTDPAKAGFENKIFIALFQKYILKKLLIDHFQCQSGI